MRLAALFAALILFSAGRSLVHCRADLKIDIPSPPLRMVWQEWVDRLLRRDPDPDPDTDDERGDLPEGECEDDDGELVDELPPVLPSVRRPTRVEAWVMAQLPLLEARRATYKELVEQGSEILRVSPATIKRAIARVRQGATS
jgi:hypothetical protein